MTHAPAPHPARLLRARGLAPKHRAGQNFLLDADLARRIAEAASSPPGGTVLEIGAGLGALTRPLAPRVSQLVAIERDRELHALLGELLPPTPGLRLLCADATACNWLELLGTGPRPWVVAGNLPYGIAGFCIERAVAPAGAIDGAVFMVQREVADRLRGAKSEATWQQPPAAK